VRYTPGVRRREAGFTLVELLVTIAVISILAAIAIPSFFSETRKTRARAEVEPIFNDIRIRMDQYLQEKGVYPNTHTEAKLHPSDPGDGIAHSIQPLPKEWTDLNIRITGADQVFCRYTWVTGRPGDPQTGEPNPALVETTGKDVFSFKAPPYDWYYLLARCRIDPGHTDFTWAFTSSVDSSVKWSNEGQ